MNRCPNNVRRPSSAATTRPTEPSVLATVIGREGRTAEGVNNAAATGSTIERSSLQSLQTSNSMLTPPGSKARMLAEIYPPNVGVRANPWEVLQNPSKPSKALRWRLVERSETPAKGTGDAHVASFGQQEKACFESALLRLGRVISTPSSFQRGCNTPDHVSAHHGTVLRSKGRRPSAKGVSTVQSTCARRRRRAHLHPKAPGLDGHKVVNAREVGRHGP